MSIVEKPTEIRAEEMTDVEVEDGRKLAPVDTIHNDEAMKVLAGYSGDETWTGREEKKLRRKIDLKLMPVLCLTYGLQYYDKAMLSQAVRSRRSLQYKLSN